MSTHRSSFGKSFDIFLSFFSPIVVVFLLEPSVATIYFGDAVAQSPWAGLVFILLFLAKTLFVAGVYGVLVRIAAGEDDLFNWKVFSGQFLKNWPVCLGVGLLPLVLHFLAFGLFPGRDIELASIQTFGDLVFCYLLASAVVSSEYLRPMGQGRRRILISFREAGVLLGLFGLSAVVYGAAKVPAPGLVDYPRIAFLPLKAIHFFTFIYLAQLILDAYPEIRARFLSDRELVLINPVGPGILEGIASLVVYSRTYPPVFVVLRALTPKSFRVREFNRALWNDRYYTDHGLVAITAFTSNCSEAYKLAKEFKRRGARVVMGGPHVSYLPDEALEYCDSVVTGEAEGIWPQVVADYEAGTLKPRYDGVPSEENHQIVHQELLNSPPAVIKDFLETTRGCKFKCHFCTIPSFSGERVRKKPVFEVVELLEKVRTKYRNVTFIDNNIYSDPAYARELFRALKPLRMQWSTQCTIDIAKNDETLKLAKEAGCTGFLFGYEIYDKSQEHQQGGKYAMAENYLRYTEKIKAAGLLIKAHYIFGYDTDTFRSLFSMWRFCFSVMPYMTVVSLLTPLPGSALYVDMLKANRITDLNWHNYTCHSLVFRHERMNNAVLAAVYPFIYVFFLSTTSQEGFVVLWLLIAANVIYFF
ncbi:MAG: radical SAM protein [Candidatus Omnitrophota bacterium]|nr:radical SAM protein [Candidatus Omnitrophota bacterium]MDZ4242185.1 radical SAM protein [Candidatus Omnitrophota bacterium]